MFFQKKQSILSLASIVYVLYPIFNKNKNCKYYYNNNCVDTCPENTYLVSNQCVSDCPEEQPYKDEVNKKCVASCPVDDNVYTDERYKQCVSSCTRNYNDFTDELNKQCIDYDTCPAGTYTNVFDKKCHHPDECPSDRKTDTLHETCTISCNTGDTYNYMDPNGKKFCLETCSDDKPYIRFRTCYASCPIYVNPIDNSCVETCPDGYVPNETTKFCDPI